MRSRQQRGGPSRRRYRMVMRTRTKLSAKKVVIVAASAVILMTSGLFIFFNISNSENARAAVSGDYRTKASGNWNSTSTWEKYNGTSWVAATATPTSANGVIEILSGHTVTVTANVTVDQTIVDVGGTLVINASRYLYEANGTGTDLTVNGTLTVNGSGYLTENASSSIVVNGTVTLSSGAVDQIAAGATFTINSGGIVINNGGTLPTSAGLWIVNSGGTFRHNANGGTLPLATWNTGSICEITGVTTTAPGNLNQSFYNFNWNTISQTAAINLNASLQTITGDLTIASTGTSYIQLDQQGNNNSLAIGGNFNITGGTIYACTNGSTTINLTGNYIQSGGSFSFSKSGGTAYGNNSTAMNVSGNLTVSGGTLNLSQCDANNASKGIGQIYLQGNISLSGSGLITETSTLSSGQIYFTGTSAQYYTSSSSSNVTQQINFTVNSGAILRMDDQVMTGAGNFSLLSGGSLMIGSANGISTTGSSGNIQVTGTRSYSTTADYTYNATSSQSVGAGLPATTHNLTVNNPAGLTISDDITVSNLLTFVSGTINTGGEEINVTNNSITSISGHSSTNYIIGKLRRSVAGSGSYDFPIGTSANYELANINLTSATGFTNISASFANSNPIGLPLSGIVINGTTVDNMLDYGYWTIDPNTSMTGGTYTVTLNEKGQSVSGPSAQSHAVLVRPNITTAWSSQGTHNNNTQSMGSSTVTAARAGLNSFANHHFGVGYAGAGSLPIELVYFKAVLNDGQVNLSWATASELNNDYFTVERSGDGIHFEEVLRKNGAGNSTNTLYYNDKDENPLKRYSYYRLKQTDYDGHFTYSEIETIKNKANSEEESSMKITSVSPNPFIEKFTVSFLLKTASVVEFQLYNSSGQVVYKSVINTNDGMNQYDYVDELGLPPGMYIMNLIYNDQKVTQKIIKK